MVVSNQPLDFTVLEQMSPSAAQDVKNYWNECGHAPDMTKLSVGDVLHAYLMWNGILGYTSRIIAIIDSVKEITHG